jgi:hypothetical protein
MDINNLLERLKAAGFTGTVKLHLSRGEVNSVKLIHHLAADEINLPVIEETEFALKP